MCQWLSAMCAASDVSVASFLMDSLTSLFNGETHNQGLGHAPLAIMLVLAVDAQLTGLQWYGHATSLPSNVPVSCLPLQPTSELLSGGAALFTTPPYDFCPLICLLAALPPPTLPHSCPPHSHSTPQNLPLWTLSYTYLLERYGQVHRVVCGPLYVCVCMCVCCVCVCVCVFGVCVCVCVCVLCV